MRRYQSLEKGQVLLVVVLVMVVVLTIGLSIVTRSITSLRTSQEDESSQKAFSAAEAGVEQIINSASLSKNSSLGDDGTSYTVNTATIGGSTNFLINNYSTVGKNDGADVWLSPYPITTDDGFDGDITVFWGKAGETCSVTPQLNSQAAVEIAVISGPLGAPIMNRFAYDPCSARAAQNHFSTSVLAGQTVDGHVFAHRIQITNIVDGHIMRIIPIYASTVIGVSSGGGGPNLPTQGQLIESTGKSGDTERKIQVFKGYPKVPNEFFPMGIFSP